MGAVIKITGHSRCGGGLLQFQRAKSHFAARRWAGISQVLSDQSHSESDSVQILHLVKILRCVFRQNFIRAPTVTEGNSTEKLLSSTMLETCVQFPKHFSFFGTNANVMRLHYRTELQKYNVPHASCLSYTTIGAGPPKMALELLTTFR